jgi:hypothetical protein
LERRIIVKRSRETGVYVLNPMGTFKGYGGYVGIGPYRELGATCSDGELGEVAISMIQAAGPTGYHIRDIIRYQDEHYDEETLRIAKTHTPPRKAGDAWIDRKFTIAGVRLKDGQKSWSLLRDRYDHAKRWFKAGKPVRVRIDRGAVALGEALVGLLAP